MPSARVPLLNDEGKLPDDYTPELALQARDDAEAAAADAEATAANIPAQASEAVSSAVTGLSLLKTTDQQAPRVGIRDRFRVLDIKGRWSIMVNKAGEFLVRIIRLGDFRITLGQNSKGIRVRDIAGRTSVELKSNGAFLVKRLEVPRGSLNPVPSLKIGAPAIISSGRMNDMTDPKFKGWPAPVVLTHGDTLGAHVGRVVVLYNLGNYHADPTNEMNLVATWSDDRGRTWQKEPILVKHSTDQGGTKTFSVGYAADGSIIAWSETTPAGASGGDPGDGFPTFSVHRSADGGQTWTEIIPSFTPTYDINEIYGMRIRPSDGALQAMWFDSVGSSAWGWLLSYDNGATWTQTRLQTGQSLEDQVAELHIVYNAAGLGIAHSRRRSGSSSQTPYRLRSADGFDTFDRATSNITDNGRSNIAMALLRKNMVVAVGAYRGEGVTKALMWARWAYFEDLWNDKDALSAPQYFARGGSTADSSGDSGQPQLVALDDNEALAFWYDGADYNTSLYCAPITFDDSIGDQELLMHSGEMRHFGTWQPRLTTLGSSEARCYPIAGAGTLLVSGQHSFIDEWTHGKIQVRIKGSGKSTTSSSGAGGLRIALRYYMTESLTMSTLILQDVQLAALNQMQQFDTGFVDAPLKLGNHRDGLGDKFEIVVTPILGATAAQVYDDFTVEFYTQQ